MAGTLNDEILRVTGGPTINDGLLSWFRRGGASINTAYGDAERQWLCSQLGFQTTVAATNNDLWRQFLAAFPGTIQDQMLAYWSGNPTPGALGSLFAAGEQGMWYEPDVPTNIGPVRRNLLFWSEDITVAPTWVFTNVSGTATRVGNVLTFGASNIDRDIQGQVTLALNDVVTASALLSGSGTVRLIVFSGAGGGTGPDIVLTSTPTLYSVTLTNPTAGANGGAGIYNNSAGIAGAVVTVGYVQLEFGPVATAYQKVTDWNTEYLAVAGNNVTCFQDFSGTTAVWAVEQPVGLILDRRLGRGSELATNGNFAAGGTGWNAQAGWSFSGGQALVDSSVAGSTILRTAAPTVIGTWYQITFTVVSVSGAGLRVIAGGTQSGNTLVQTPGTYTQYALANTIEGAGVFASSTTTMAVISNVSAKALPGNHATQATAASRPVLSARKNLLTKTEQFNVAPWAALATASLTSGQADPFGGTAATRVLITSTGVLSFYQQPIIAPSTALTYTIYIKPDTIVDPVAGFYLRNDTTTTNIAPVTVTWATMTVTGAGGSITAVGNGWYRLTVTATTGITVGDTMRVYAGFIGVVYTIGHSYFISNPQLEIGSVATRYQRVNTATDYDAVGFPHYLRFDGSDDFLLTANVNFTTTDKMTVWSGVSQDVVGTTLNIIELSVSAAANPGAFALQFDSGAPYAFTTRLSGTTGGFGVEAESGTPTQPRKLVTSTLFDIAQTIVADEIVNRINGVANAGAIFGTASTGTFGTFPVYVGRRGGTTLPFNGPIYNLVVRGAASSAAQISSTENYIAGKMQIVIP